MKIFTLFAVIVAFLAFANCQSPADWSGTWTAHDRYGGVLYLCVVGDTVYGVYSKAGFLEGKIDPVNPRRIEGVFLRWKR